MTAAGKPYTTAKVTTNGLLQPVKYDHHHHYGMAPNYIQDLCVLVSTVSTRSALRSAARGDLVIPRTRRRLGNRAFSVAGPAAWNSLPPDIRTASTLGSFKNR